MAQNINIKGGAELKAFLEQLPAKMEKNIMRGALRAGAVVIQKEAKNNVPVSDGDLKRSIRVSTKSKGGVVTATIKAGNEKAFYWRFVEYGTASHVIKAKNKKALSFGSFLGKSLLHPGAVAKPFMRPALDTKAAEAIQAVGDMIKKRLTKQGIDASNTDFSVEEN